MISSASFSESGCYKEPRTIAGITSKGAKQSDLFYTQYFRPEHELTAIHACINPDGSLRGVQLQAGVHNSVKLYDSYDLFALGNMQTDPKKPRSCFSDFHLDDLHVKNATVFWNDTQVTGLSLMYNDLSHKLYGSM